MDGVGRFDRSLAFTRAVEVQLCGVGNPEPLSLLGQFKHVGVGSDGESKRPPATAADGRSVRIQKRGRPGSFKTVAQATLRDAGQSCSSYSRRLRVKADGVFRARFGVALSRTRRLDVSP